MLLSGSLIIEIVNEGYGWVSRVYANFSTCDSYFQIISTCIHMKEMNPELTSALASGCVVKCQKWLPRVIRH